VQRNVVLRLPNFLGIGALVASTDLVVTVPQRVAVTLLRIADVKRYPPPFELPSFAIKQHWHMRYHQDPANRWLRSVITDLFLES
jgi:DNA-binding transcriptional LysR family regulator